MYVLPNRPSYNQSRLQRRSYRTTAGPTGLPLSLADVKTQARVASDVTDEDAMMTAHLQTAVLEVETHSQLIGLMREEVMGIDLWPPDDEIWIDRGPIRSIDYIKYIDPDGVQQTISASNYSVDLSSQIARIWTVDSFTWPAHDDVPNAITIGYKAGFGQLLTVDASANTFAANYIPAVGEIVRFYNSGGALPGGLSADRDYFVVSPTATTFQVSLTSGGSAVDITTAGTGNTYAGLALPPAFLQAIRLRVAMYFNEREGYEFEKAERAYWSLINTIRIDI